MLLKYKYSICVALIIMYLSLTSSHTFDKVPLINIPYFDKFIHFGMYFLLMTAILFESRKQLISSGRLFLLALYPLFYGIIMELLQITITKTRTGDFFDFLANAAGTVACVFLWILFKPRLKNYFR